MYRFEPTGISLKIFKERYAFTEDETWTEACRRVARQMAIAESTDKVQKYEDKFFEIIVSNLFVPGGRIIYGSGRTNPQLLNCFVLENELDSKEGWGQISYEMIVTSMSGGGCGIDFSDVRPCGAEIRGHKGICPGPIELMRLINHNGDPVRAGGGRRTALMFSLDLSHPDIDIFIKAKDDFRAFNNANFSIRSCNTTKFIEAVKSGSPLELSWKGRFKKSIDARSIWDTVVKKAWEGAEPGLLNWELVLSEHNTWYVQPLITTNPCGELPLEKHGACCLGSLVLFRFVKDGKIDWELLGETIRTAVRFLDNVLSVNSFPLPQMKQQSDKLRRIGLGTTGLADMLVLLGYQYGSVAADAFCDKLYRFISKQAYEASVMLAIEKGPFPACVPSLHVKSGYMKRMTSKIRNLVEEHGIRNATILTQPPAGTGSILSGNCTSGIESMFAPAYWRNYRSGENIVKELMFHPLFTQFMQEGKDTSVFVSAHELNIRQHMQMQKTIQKHIDSSVSKTINMPKDQDIQEMSDAWLEYMPYLKGVTFYRDGCRDHMFEGMPQPLTPVSHEDAIRLYKESISVKEEAAPVIDCPKGVCSL